MASPALATSLETARNTARTLDRHFNVDDEIVRAKYTHISALYPVPVDGSTPSLPFQGGQQTWDFEIKNLPDKRLKPGLRSILLEMKITETGGVNPVTLNFAEMLLDKNQGFEWTMNGSTPLCDNVSSLRAVFQPALDMEDPQYNSLCNVMNHDTALSHGSEIAIAAGGTALYWVVVPHPFGTEGFYLGNFGNSTVRLRCRSQATSAVYSGTGTPTLKESRLWLDCINVPTDHYAEYGRQLRAGQIKWVSKDMRLMEVPTLISPPSAGDIGNLIQLQALKGVPMQYLTFVLHANRGFTQATDWWTTLKLPDTAQVALTDRAGNQLFTSDRCFYNLMKNVLAINDFGNSKLLQNFAMGYVSGSPNIQEALNLGIDKAKGVFWLTGDEYLHLYDTGISSNYNVEVMAWYNIYYRQKPNGDIERVESF